MLLELIAGIVVTLTALALVLEPLVRPGGDLPGSAGDEADFVDIEDSESPKVRALLALREIEFDRATGKLSDEDYAQLRTKYAAAAVAAIKDEDQSASPAPAAVSAGGEDPAEALVKRFKQRSPDARCPTCGPRPEPGAVFCSTCGRSLIKPGASSRCFHCGNELPDGAKFCSACGGRIAA